MQMIELAKNIAKEHSRVIHPTEDFFSKFEYFRHLFPYHEVARRLQQNSTLLEVGFGSGYGAGFLSEKCTNITATEISEDPVIYARALYDKVNFCVASGTSLPFDENSFDYIISFQVIEHIPDSIKFLREIFRVLKPGGEVCLTTPNRRLRLFPFQKPWNSDHVREYSDQGLLKEIISIFPEPYIHRLISRRELMEMEMDRVSPWVSIQHRLTERIFGTTRKHVLINNETDFKTVSLDDFFITKDGTKKCLDLICYAVKSNI